MGETTLLKKKEEMVRKPLVECHEGVGTSDFTTVLNGKERAGMRVNFMHDDTMPPGVSFGVHKHEDDEEYYYFLSGCGIMTLDGERFEVKAGDIAAVYPGGSHGLENNSDEDLRLIVISVS